MRRRNSLASLLVIRDQLTVPATTTISSVVERMRHALGSINIRAFAAIRLRIGSPKSCKLGIARTAQEQVLNKTLASETEGKLIGDDVDD
jgi:hypothetical protein